MLSCFGDFAVVRGDRWEAPATGFLLLFQQGRLAQSRRSGSRRRLGEPDERFMSRAAEAAVLDVVQEYYRAVTHSDGAAIWRIFASCWHMKNHEEDVVDGSLVSEEMDAFVERLEGSYPGYWNDRQIADAQVAFNRIALVRVDRPSTPSTTVFLLARIDGLWKVIDKAFTDGRKPEPP